MTLHTYMKHNPRVMWNQMCLIILIKLNMILNITHETCHITGINYVTYETCTCI